MNIDEEMIFRRGLRIGIKKTLYIIEKELLPNADNSNPCMKCGSIQCARCGFDMLKDFEKIKKKLT